MKTWRFITFSMGKYWHLFSLQKCWIPTQFQMLNDRIQMSGAQWKWIFYFWVLWDLSCWGGMEIRIFLETYYGEYFPIELQCAIQWNKFDGKCLFCIHRMFSPHTGTRSSLWHNLSINTSESDRILTVSPTSTAAILKNKRPTASPADLHHPSPNGYVNK